MRVFAIWLLILGFWSGGFAGDLPTYDHQYRHFILNWEAPLEAQKRFPYFISGLDIDKSPVCVFPFGSWDIRSYLERDRGNAEIMRRYSEQMFTRFHESSSLFGQSLDPLGGYVIIADLDQYSLRQILHFDSLRALFDTAVQFQRLNRDHVRVKRVYVVNANILFRIVYQFVRPILGRLSSIVELHGRNRGRWVPVLLRTISQDQLPSKLGGTLVHKPIEIFG